MTVKRFFSSLGCLLLVIAMPIAATLMALFAEPLSSPSFSIFTDLTFLASLLFFGLLAIEVISAFFIGDSTYHTALLAGALLLACIVSPTVAISYTEMGVESDRTIFEMVSSSCLLIALFAGVLFDDYTYGPLPHPTAVKISALAVYVSFIALMIASPFIPFLELWHIELAAGIFAVVQYSFCYFHGLYHNKDDSTFYLSGLIFSLTMGILFGYATADAMALDDTLLSSVTSLSFLAIAAIFVSIYAAFVIRTDKKAREAERMELEAEKIRLRVLKAQIKPHFIFNALSTLRTAYHDDLDKGDEALMAFARYLRLSIIGMDSETIPFTAEIESVESFVKLVNVGSQHPFEIIYDIAYDDFEIPPLTIGTFVENCIKHSRVNERPDGIIEISSHLYRDENIVITISDNGVGFDTSLERGASSVGIKNCIERLSLSSQAKVAIDSSPGKGTKVTIEILQGGGRKKGALTNGK